MITPWLTEIFTAAYVPDANRRHDPLASPAWGDNSRDIAGGGEVFEGQRALAAVLAPQHAVGVPGAVFLGVDACHNP